MISNIKNALTRRLRRRRMATTCNCGFHDWERVESSKWSGDEIGRPGVMIKGEVRRCKICGETKERLTALTPEGLYFGKYVWVERRTVYV